MLINLSNPNNEHDASIKKQLGNRLPMDEFEYLEELERNSFIILEASGSINTLFPKGSHYPELDFILHENGMLMRFQIASEVYALMIIYHKLTVFKGAGKWSFYLGEHFLKVKKDQEDYLKQLVLWIWDYVS